MSSSQKKNVLLLKLEDYSWLSEMFENFLQALHSKANVTQCTDATTALEIITAGTQAAVLLWEPSIIKKKNRKLADALAEYTKSGGITIFAACCSCFARPPDIDKFFDKVFGLPWKYGNHLRTTFTANPGARLNLTDKIAASYSMKAVHLKNIAKEDLVYLTTEGSVLESMVFWPAKVDLVGEGPVVFAQYHHGKLGWVGDVNNERETGSLVFAMLGL